MDLPILPSEFEREKRMLVLLMCSIKIDVIICVELSDMISSSNGQGLYLYPLLILVA